MRAAFGETDVLVDEVAVRVHDGEFARRAAADHIGSAGGRLVEQLAEEHGTSGR
jgi:hypothetical protein